MDFTDTAPLRYASLRFASSARGSQRGGAFRLAACALLSAATLSSALSGAELVTFSSGFQMTVDAHRLDGAEYILLQPGGAIQVPQQAVASIESIPSEAPATAPMSPAAASLSAAVSPLEPKALLAEAALDAGLPATLVISVAKVESAFLSAAKSPKGALGLMQLMPATAAALGVAADDPRANAFGGAQYLRQLLIRYGGQARLALAAYNAGPAAVDRFHEVPAIEETQIYVDRVLREYDRLEAARQRAASRLHSSGSAAPAASSLGH
jgi:soluble lytic murein transglycosylase-like protein